jgi:CDP-diacylglycerol--glycerol-3-phosphate 3-phosphatidyltransferase
MSKYEHLWKWIRDNGTDSFKLTYAEIEEITGVLLFILPLTFPIVPLKYLAIPVCAVATFAAVQEGHFIRTDPDIK